MFPWSNLFLAKIIGVTELTPKQCKEGLGYLVKIFNCFILF